jgi:hypothetical protein
MAWFRNSYRHDECGLGWTDEWSCACNDRCPECNAEIEPYASEDLSVLVEAHKDGEQWVVFVSSPDAEDKPHYVETCFDQKQDAHAFAGEEILRLCD